MNFFGSSLPAGQSPSLAKNLELARNYAVEAAKKQQLRNEKLAKISKLNELLTAGYINNLNVIVDISKLLNEYKLTIDEIFKQLQQIDQFAAKELDGLSLDHIKELTSESVANIGKFFQTEVKNIKDLLSSVGKTAEIEKLNRTEQNFKDTFDQANNVITTVGVAKGGCNTCGGKKSKQTKQQKKNKGKKAAAKSSSKKASKTKK